VAQQPVGWYYHSREEACKVKLRDPGSWLLGFIMGVVIGAGIILAFQWELGLPWGS
jgi:hypothetical protein